MGAPLEIDEGLYWESKFDTEALLRNLTDKLLSKVGYDYQGVMVRYLDPQLRPAATEEVQEYPVQMGQMLSPRSLDHHPNSRGVPARSAPLR